MARSSLGQLLMVVLVPAVLLTTGCLVTENPDFTPPGRTRPNLIPVTPTTEFVRVVKLNSVYTVPAFKAEVSSEDDGQQLRTALLIDYGVVAGGAPWTEHEVGPILPAMSLDDGFRPVDILWIPEDGTEPGCHTVTMLATHERKDEGAAFLCPKDPDDAGTLTWFVTLCEETDSCDFTNCPVKGDAEYVYCEGLEQQMGTP